MKKSINPLTSIIVPNYNHAPFLKQRLESIYNQTYQNFEVILLDDASTDQSLSILNNYKEYSKTTHLIVNKQNSGSPFKQWKKGIDLAQGEYIWIAESDDYCELSFLEKMMKFFNENPTLGLSYCQTEDVDECGKHILNRIDYTQEFIPNIWGNDFVLSGKEFLSNYLIVKNVIPNASAVLFKKGLITEDFFSESLVSMKMCGDWYFWIQISLKTRIGFKSEVFNYFRNHKSVSRNHTSHTVKKRRLLEESVIRSYLQEKKINNTKAEHKLYKQWFGLHQFLSVFSPSFYQIKLSKTATFTFLKQFLRFKLTK